MKKNFLRKCDVCGKVILEVESSDKPLVCCDTLMREVVANSTDASLEKHVPNVEYSGEKIIVRVNHVMEVDHYIPWIMMVSDNGVDISYLKPGDEAKAVFLKKDGATIYAYCNKHELWMKEIG